MNEFKGINFKLQKFFYSDLYQEIIDCGYKKCYLDNIYDWFRGQLFIIEEQLYWMILEGLENENPL